MGFLGFYIDGGGVKLSPCLKLVRIMIEAWKLMDRYTHIFSFRKYTLKCQDPVNFVEVSFFFFLEKVNIFMQK